MVDSNPSSSPRLGSRLRSAILGVLGDAGTDGELLLRFVRTQDDAVFAELVRRLGPMVRGICRGVLGPGPDADDAFQAVFVVLARKAEAVRPPGRVAAWVHGVATLTARKARQARSRRERRESPLAPSFDPPHRIATAEPDLGPALAEEIGRLPEKYRLPVVLCLVRELTAAKAASELGWPVGTVNTRLSRGRALLGNRLIRRGLGLATVSAGAVAPADAAGLPSELIFETTRSATAGAALVPAHILTLSSEVIAAMFVSKIRLVVAGGLLAAAVTATGIGSLMPHTTAAPPPATAAPGKDPLDRIKLTRLAALVKPEGIQQDLGFTEEIKAKIEEARKKMNEEMQETIKGMAMKGVARPVPVGGAGGGGGFGGVVMASAAGDMSKVMNEHQAAFDKAILGALSEVQIHRLKQIYLQTLGASALLDRRVIRALDLTADQEDEIEKTLPVAPLPVAPAGRGDNEPKVKEVETALTAATKVLTSAQKEKWTALVGKPVPTADLILAGGPISGGASFSVAGGGVMAGPAGAVAPVPVKPIKP